MTTNAIETRFEWTPSIIERVKRGLFPRNNYHGRVAKWPEGTLDLLGNVPDQVIADKLGLSRVAIALRRKKLGLKRFGREKIIARFNAIEKHRDSIIVRLRFSGKSLRDLVEEKYPGWGGKKRMAESAGVSPQSLNGWLHGRLPREKEVIKMAYALGLPDPFSESNAVRAHLLSPSRGDI